MRLSRFTHFFENFSKKLLNQLYATLKNALKSPKNNIYVLLSDLFT